VAVLAPGLAPGAPLWADAAAASLSGASGTTIHITMYRTTNSPAVTNASIAQMIRTIEGSASR
jgi:hypothetical protein